MSEIDDEARALEDELRRAHPDRTDLRLTDADGFRAVWPVVVGLWDETVERARALDPALLHERVDGEWSFVETLRHLAYATDTWIGRVLGGDPSPWHPLDLPFDELTVVEGLTVDREARPSLDDVLAVRRDRQAMFERAIADLTDEALAGTTTPNEAPGWPPPRAYPVLGVLVTIVNEEWWHRTFAERDLAVLVTRGR